MVFDFTKQLLLLIVAPDLSFKNYKTLVFNFSLKT